MVRPAWMLRAMRRLPSRPSRLSSSATLARLRPLPAACVARLAPAREQRVDPVGPDGDERPASRADSLAESLAVKRQQVEQILRKAIARKLVAVDEIASTVG
jgi:hypothetical protein